MHDGHAELRRPLRGCRRAARGQQADLQAGPLGPDQPGTVLDVEPFALGPVRVEQNLAVGQDAVDIEQQQAETGGVHVQ